MKIFVVTTGENIPLLGDRGQKMRSSILCEKLSINNDVTYVTSNFNHFSKKKRNNNNVINARYKILQIKTSEYKKNISIARFVNHFLFSFKLFFFLLPKKIDIIVCSYPLIECCAVVKLLSKFKNYKLFYDVRDLWPDNFERTIFNLPVIFFYKFLMKLSLNNESIITISNSYKKWIISNKIKTSDIKVFPLSSSSNSLGNLSNQKKINKKKIIFWFLGSLGHSYDLVHILKHASYLRNKNVEIIISGDGFKKKYLQKKYSHNKNIIFTGWLSENKIKYYSNVAHIGLMAYSKNATQGYPNKLFDYLSWGLPVMSSLKNKETICLIKKNNLGWNYDIGSSYSIINSFNNIFKEQKKLENKSSHIRRFYKNNFNKNKIYEDFSYYIENAK